MADLENADSPPPWHAQYPSPLKTAHEISREEVLSMLQGSPSDVSQEKKTCLLVDLRRSDFEGGTIYSAINLPAQTLYHSIPILYELFRNAGLEKVIWFCSSSRGRGPRAAGWFADYLANRRDDSIQSLVLIGGVKGWATAALAAPLNSEQALVNRNLHEARDILGGLLSPILGGLGHPTSEAGLGDNDDRVRSLFKRHIPEARGVLSALLSPALDGLEDLTSEPGLGDNFDDPIKK